MFAFACITPFTNAMKHLELLTTPLFEVQIVDISECAVVVLSEPVEKHDRCIYEVGAKVFSNERRAEIFSKVLGTSIMYEQQTIEDFYKTNISSAMNHSLVYDLIKLAFNGEGKKATLQLAVILNRPLRTFEEWLQDNIQLFQWK
ncbi:unnamed protein product [Rotaria socialis]|uniref:NmrA-like domain-containing protein n=1 Tax=Rotaria socialis TaxID=392032 RepID=A0A817X2U1_9BILA|nr:unnamed protein product [Rotaria socialis]